ncbi:MAG: hypothetical protein D6734_04320, partial [Candidatus Schekmanbacteria bacterium]
CLPEREPLAPLNPPERIAGLELKDSILGRPALRELYRLHGKSVELKNGYVAQYSNGRDDATIYYSETQNEEKAKELIERMVKKISEGNRFFTGLREVKKDNQSLYWVVGMGQEHYFFRNGKRIIWIAADRDVIENVLSEYLSFLLKEVRIAEK